MNTVAVFPAVFLPEEDGRGYHVRFPDLPEALTSGNDWVDTTLEATDCLAEALAGRMLRGEAIPKPGRVKPGQQAIGVPLYLAPKLALYVTMLERKLHNTDLARLLGVSETVVRRMLNPRHATKPEKLQAALAVLGKRIVVRVEDIAAA